MLEAKTSSLHHNSKIIESCPFGYINLNYVDIVKSLIFNFLLFSFLTTLSFSNHSKNQFISSFSKAKDFLHDYVYFDNRKTLYCNANFNELKVIDFPKGFLTNKYIKRAKRIEWEHAVPAESFGKGFPEWIKGDPKCITKNGDLYKGRKCANKINEEFRYMLSDMYNLFPAIGSVNALRSSYDFEILDNTIKSDFGSCDMRVDNKKVHPPEQAKGRIARAYIYMDHTYRKFEMSSRQRDLMTLWNKQYPVTTWECLRANRIKAIQGNDHVIYAKVCSKSL